MTIENSLPFDLSGDLQELALIAAASSPDAVDALVRSLLANDEPATEAAPAQTTIRAAA